jgi:hypothetical protein
MIRQAAAAYILLSFTDDMPPLRDFWNRGFSARQLTGKRAAIHPFYARGMHLQTHWLLWLRADYFRPNA